MPIQDFDAYNNHFRWALCKSPGHCVWLRAERCWTQSFLRRLVHQTTTPMIRPPTHPCTHLGFHDLQQNFQQSPLMIVMIMIRMVVCNYQHKLNIIPQAIALLLPIQILSQCSASPLLLTVSAVLLAPTSAFISPTPFISTVATHTLANGSLGMGFFDRLLGRSKAADVSHILIKGPNANT